MMLPWPLSSKQKPATTSRRYYYSDDSDLFEKSLDVYQPVALVADTEYSKEKKQDLPFVEDARLSSRLNDRYDDLPVVILVVGSGWVGHRAWVYSGTSWWNSAGPETVASLGCTCVCIRHRGAFFHVRPYAYQLATMLAALLAFLVVVLPSWEYAVSIVGIITAVLMTWTIQAEGAASFDDMLNDVGEALQWIRENPDELALLTATKTTAAETLTTTAADTAKENKWKQDSHISDDTASTAPLSTSSIADNDSTNSTNFSGNRRPIIFGGYSSGGHVAATLLQTPDLFSKHNLPAADDWFQGALLISGVLAVRHVVTSVNGNAAANSSALQRQQQSPMWLIDFGMDFVWGPEAHGNIPSPLEQVTRHPENVPRLPHLLVGCRNELFGLKWLDAFFCSEAYAVQVQAVLADATANTKGDDTGSRNGENQSSGFLGALQTLLSPRAQKQSETAVDSSSGGLFVKYSEIESDHWNILGSDALREALRENLPHLIA